MSVDSVVKLVAFNINSFTSLLLIQGALRLEPYNRSRAENDKGQVIFSYDDTDSHSPMGVNRDVLKPPAMTTNNIVDTMWFHNVQTQQIKTNSSFNNF